MTLAFIIAILIWGFAIGGLARFAVPGPDPMPIWMTTAIGIGGSLIGGILSRLLFGTPRVSSLPFSAPSCSWSCTGSMSSTGRSQALALSGRRRLTKQARSSAARFRAGIS